MNDFRSIVTDLEMLKNLSPTTDMNYLTMDSFKESFMGSEDDLCLKTINFENDDCFSIDSSIDKIDHISVERDTVDIDKLMSMPDLDKINLRDFTRSSRNTYNNEKHKCVNVILGYDHLKLGWNEKKSDIKRCNNIQCSNCDKMVKIFDNFSLNKDFKL